MSILVGRTCNVYKIARDDNGEPIFSEREMQKPPQMRYPEKIMHFEGIIVGIEFSPPHREFFALVQNYRGEPWTVSMDFVELTPPIGVDDQSIIEPTHLAPKGMN